MNQSDKLKEIIKERNEVIKYYKDKSQGIMELCDLLKCLLYALLKSNKKSTISKKDISDSIGKSLLTFLDDEENYYISVCDPTELADVCESDEEDKI